MKISFERNGIALVVAVPVAVTWGNTVGVICADILKMSTPVPYLAISLTTIVFGMLIGLMLSRYSHRSRFGRWLPVLSLALGSVACLGLNQYYHMLPILAPVFLFASVLYGIGLPWIARRLPVSLDGSFSKHRRLGVSWIVLGVLMIILSARMSIFMADLSQGWAAVVPDAVKPGDDFYIKMDLAAYIYAGDLSHQGVANVYDANYYRHPETSVLNLSKSLFSHFEYSPPFLLLSRLALALTNNFLTIRAVWFAIDASLVALIMILLAQWVGERNGMIAALLLPVIWISLPIMYNFQLGQFHITCIALSMAAMMAFDRKRHALGGAMLAIAVITKIFPGLMILYLLIQRRWREVAWTLGFSALLGVLGLIVLGPDPYTAFVNYQIPRILKGEAIAFFNGDAAISTNNQSIYGLVDKLVMLGLPGNWNTLTSMAGWIYTLFLLGLSVMAARSSTSRIKQAQIWLLLLSLAALRSPSAPGVYEVGTTLWLCTFLVDDFRGQMWKLVLYVMIFVGLVGFPYPEAGTLQVYLSLIGQVIWLIFNIRVIMRACSQSNPSLAQVEPIPI